MHFKRTRLWIAATAIAVQTSVELAAAAPNILFIMTDDHGYQAVGAYGSGLNTTPNIDRIAAAGVRFDRCYVTDSLCGPSRACLLTGKYGDLNGFVDNRSTFDGSQLTFPKLLQAAGYQTAVVGKWHLVSEPTGFDYWDVLPGQGQYYRPEFLSKHGERKEPEYVTEVTTRLALQWLKQDRDPQKPFCLLVHHKAPHRPWQPSPAHLGDLAGKKFPEPKTLFDDYSTRSGAARRATMRIWQMDPPIDLKTWSADDREHKFVYGRMSPANRALWDEKMGPRRAEFAKLPESGPERTRWMYQRYIQDYLECVESVDDSVGELLDYLDEAKLTDDTIVVYTSDQGFYLGEHGWFDKRFMYEQSLRTPLVVHWPGVTTAGRTEGRIASNLDFAETFLDAAGVAIPPEMQGRSLRPLLADKPTPDWRTSFFYKYHEGLEQYHHVEKHEGVTNGRQKLIHFTDSDAWELYDLVRDPDEVHNVFGRPEFSAIQQELAAELAQLKKQYAIKD